MLHKVYILDKNFDWNIFQEGERYYDMIFCSWPWIVVSRSTKIISLKLSEWFQSYQQGLSPVFSRHACVFSHVTMTMHQLALQHLSALNVTLIKNSKCSFGHETSRQSCVYVITSLFAFEHVLWEHRAQSLGCSPKLLEASITLYFLLALRLKLLHKHGHDVLQ